MRFRGRLMLRRRRRALCVYTHLFRAPHVTDSVPIQVGLFNGAYTTADLYNASQPGQSLYGVEETNGGLVVFGGGLPIFLDGHFIGAVGVSGGSTTQDTMVATAGVAGLKGAVS